MDLLILQYNCNSTYSLCELSQTKGERGSSFVLVQERWASEGTIRGLPMDVRVLFDASSHSTVMETKLAIDSKHGVCVLVEGPRGKLRLASLSCLIRNWMVIHRFGFSAC